VILSLIGYGVNEQGPRYAVAAAALACAFVTGAEACLLGKAGRRVSSELAVWFVQLNVIVSAAVPVLWYTAQKWIKGRADASRYPTWPLILGRVAMGAVLFLAALALWMAPGAARQVAAAGSLWSFLAVLSVEAALLITCRRPSRDRQGHRESVWILFATVLLACAPAPLDSGNWLCFHVLMCGFVAAGWVRLYAGDRQIRQLLGPGWQETFDAVSAAASGRVQEIGHDLSCADCGYNLRGLAPSSRCPECGGAIAASLQAAVERLTPQRTAQFAQARTQAIGAVLACVILGTLFAMRAAIDDPQRPWWSSAVLAALATLCMAVAGWAPRRALAYLGGIELCLAASVWWVIAHWQKGTWTAEEDLINLVNINVVALALAGVAWWFLERRVVLQRSTAASLERWPAFHHAAAGLSTVVVAVLAGQALYGAAIEQPLADVTLTSWLAWGAAVAIVIACSLDAISRRHVPAALYILGLAGVVRIMAGSGLTPRSLMWAISVGLAGYALLTTVVWRRWGTTVGDSLERAGTVPRLLYANGTLVSVSVLLAAFVSLTHPELAWRMLVIISPLLCGASALLASVGSRRLTMLTCAAALFVTGGVLLAWSWVPPDAADGMLTRSVGFIAVAVATVAFAAIATRVAPGHSWTTAVARCTVGSSVLAGAALLNCAGSEVAMLMNRRAVSLPAPAVAALVASLAVTIVCCILFATRDRFDPLRLNASRKEAYVYLAEVLAGVLALHVRATMPWLFSGIIAQYWPLLVLGLAFAAVAAGEVCERYGQRVLVRPFGRTGVFLPALALLELFIASSQVNYSVVLLTTGVLYAVLGALRRSIVYGVLAGLALNGSLWYLLQHVPGLGITQHPQLWFIPPSLAVLAAGHLNRARLTEEQRKATHYACLLGIYVSSTADVFLIGVAKAPWLPLVLMGLSVCGVFVGLASRVRSFLLLGTGFLCLSLLTMIWHAAVDLGWTWMWYVAGIVLGAVIIATFALFEKKRNEMNALLQQVKSWGD
jgi:hypothetical protein